MAAIPIDIVMLVRLGDIEDYVILERNGAHELALVVSHFIGKNWQPYGAPIRTKSSWYQTMVKFEDQRSESEA